MAETKIESQIGGRFIHSQKKLQNQSTLDAKALARKYLLREQKYKEDPSYQNTVVARSKNMLEKSVIIKPEEIGQDYFARQLKIARDQGYGKLEYTEEMKAKERDTIINTQKASFEMWFNYLSSSDAIYPIWFKSFLITNLTKYQQEIREAVNENVEQQESSGLREYKLKKRTRGKESNNTTKVFPDFNPGVASKMYALISEYNGKNKPQKLDLPNSGFEQEIKKWILANKKTFSEIWTTLSNEQLREEDLARLERNEIVGEWQLYEDGDADSLYNDLQGKGTGWCTSDSLQTAEIQLSSGEFYVYYTKKTEENPVNPDSDEDQDEFSSNFTVPRIAIRIENGQVKEVRGVNPNQQIEPMMLEIAKEKYKDLPGGDKFEKKNRDMKMLTEIDRKTNTNEGLSRAEVIFLYEFDDKIEGFGYGEDPRIDEIKGLRAENGGLVKDVEIYFPNAKPSEILIFGETPIPNSRYFFGNIQNFVSILHDKKIPPELLVEQYEKAKSRAKSDNDVHANFDILKHGNFPINKLYDYFLELRDPRIKEILLEHPNIDFTTINNLFDKKLIFSEEVRLLARNPNLSQMFFYIFEGILNQEIQVAERYNVDLESDDKTTIQYNLVKNLSCPAEVRDSILSQLDSQSHKEILERVPDDSPILDYFDQNPKKAQAVVDKAEYDSGLIRAKTSLKQSNALRTIIVESPDIGTNNFIRFFFSNPEKEEVLEVLQKISAKKLNEILGNEKFDEEEFLALIFYSGYLLGENNKEILDKIQNCVSKFRKSDDDRVIKFLGNSDQPQYLEEFLDDRLIAIHYSLLISKFLTKFDSPALALRILEYSFEQNKDVKPANVKAILDKYPNNPTIFEALLKLPDCPKFVFEKTQSYIESVNPDLNRNFDDLIGSLLRNKNCPTNVVAKYLTNFSYKHLAKSLPF